MQPAEMKRESEDADVFFQSTARLRVFGPGHLLLGLKILMLLTAYVFLGLGILDRASAACQTPQPTAS